jgi:serine protease Do
LSKQLGLDTVRGAVVTDVRVGSPAANAGLLSGDVILEFDGTSITKPADLQGRVERASLKDVHKVVVIRDGKKMSIDVRVEAMPMTVSAVEPTKAEKSTPSEFNGLGLQLSDLTPDVASQLGMSDVNGVVITGVKPSSPAANAGLEDGMVIRKVGKTSVKSVAEFGDAVKEFKPEDGVLMLVQAGESSRFVVVKG